MKNLFKNSLLFTFIVTCLSGCAYSYTDSNSSKEKYHCPKSLKDSSYNFLNVYEPNEDCSFYKSFTPIAYNFCVNKKDELKARFDAGLCEKIVIYKHNMYGAKCKAEVLEKSEKLISVECSGKNTSSAIKRIKRMYDYEDEDD